MYAERAPAGSPATEGMSVHELALSQQLARIVARAAAGRPVMAVDVELGQLRQVVPESLRQCWAVVSRTPPLSGSALRIVSVPVELECQDCLAVTTLGDVLAVACAACGSVRVRVRRGEEFRVTAIEVDDPDAPKEG